MMSNRQGNQCSRDMTQRHLKLPPEHYIIGDKNMQHGLYQKKKKNL